MSALSCRCRRLRPAAGGEGRSWTRSQIEGGFPFVPSLGSVAEIPCRASKKPASQSDRSFPFNFDAGRRRLPTLASSYPGHSVSRAPRNLSGVLASLRQTDRSFSP